jgi:hypothetical protein
MFWPLTETIGEKKFRCDEVVQQVHSWVIRVTCEDMHSCWFSRKGRQVRSATGLTAVRSLTLPTVLLHPLAVSSLFALFDVPLPNCGFLSPPALLDTILHSLVPRAVLLTWNVSEPTAFIDFFNESLATMADSAGVPQHSKNLVAERIANIDSWDSQNLINNVRSP